MICSDDLRKLAISFPGVVILSIGVGCSLTSMCKTIPQEGYITCYQGNITVEERYEQHSFMLPMSQDIFKSNDP